MKKTKLLFFGILNICFQLVCLQNSTAVEMSDKYIQSTYRADGIPLTREAALSAFAPNLKKDADLLCAGENNSAQLDNVELVGFYLIGNTVIGSMSASYKCKTESYATSKDEHITREPAFYNGKQVSYSMFPYIMHFVGFFSGRAVNSCGATLIHPRIAITAAHCLFPGIEIENVRLDGSGESAYVIDWVRHPNARGILNGIDEIDFTYLILDRPILIGDSKYPQIFLDPPTPKQIPIGTKFVAFGARADSLWTRDVLSKEPMNEIGTLAIKLNYMLRTTPATHAGESGSPLLNFNEGTPYIVGVTHGGKKPDTLTGEDRPDYYNTYVYVASAAPWLEKKIGFKTGASIAENYKNLICKMSEEWGPITLKKLLTEYLEYESGSLSCNGQPLEKLIAHKVQVAQQAAEREKIMAKKNAERMEEVEKFERQGLLSEYEYQRAFDAGATHQDAIFVAKAEKENALSTFEYVRALSAGANHKQALQLALDDKLNNISVYEYANLKAANINHDQALEVAKLDKMNKLTAFYYIRFRSEGLTHEAAKEKAKR